MFTCLATTQQRQVKSPRDPGVVSLHVNAGHFSTTARRVTSPTWGPPPPCKQALTLDSPLKFLRSGMATKNKKSWSCLLTDVLIILQVSRPKLLFGVLIFGEIRASDYEVLNVRTPAEVAI